MWNKLEDRKTLYWLFQLSGWGLFAALHFVFFWAEPSHTTPLLLTAVAIVPGVLLSFLLRRINRWIFHRSSGILRIVAWVGPVTTGMGLVWATAFWIFLDSNNPELLEEAGIVAFAAISVNCACVLFFWSLIYFGYHYWLDYKHQKERILHAESLAHKAQLQMLRYQLNPHFLFNTLNSLRALIDENPQRCKAMVTQLSEFLRYSLLGDKKPQVSLREEIQAIRNYLAIEKIRFEDSLEIKLDIDPTAEELTVPGFLLHPLVENAIKHGMRNRTSPLLIRIRAEFDNRYLRVEITNTGTWSPQSERCLPKSVGTGTGLLNFRQRLEHSFAGRYEFRTFESDGCVHAVLKVRYDKAPSASRPKVPTSFGRKAV